MRRNALLTTLIALAGTAAAHAGLFSDFYQGLNYAVTPTGSPVSPAAGGGLQNGNRFGRVRVVPNQLGNGWRLEVDRDFGADSTGRPEVFNIGVAQLTLQGNTQTTAEFTNRFHFYSGSVNSLINNLNYDLKTRIGAQDAELTGTLTANTNFTLNELGFYTLTMNVSNTSSNIALDGVVVEDPTLNTNFDIGPISIKGNLLVDAASAITTSLGANASELSGIFPKSGIGSIDQLIAESIAAKSKDSAALAAQAGDLGITVEQLTQLQTTLLSNVSAAMFQQTGSAIAAAESGPINVPEPASLALLALGTAIGFAARRR